jgi:hypothetical protein
MLTGTIALLALALISGWTLGGLLLRLGGLATVLLGLLIALTHPAGLALAAVGGLGWLAGHWLYALRHHTYKSPLAPRLYLQVLPARLDPIRHWATPTTSRYG